MMYLTMISFARPRVAGEGRFGYIDVLRISKDSSPIPTRQFTPHLFALLCKKSPVGSKDYYPAQVFE